jgi:Mrp family chromosome partitioning ATPase
VYEYAIVAAPPLLPLIAGSILSEVGGQVLLVLSIAETTRRDLSRAVEELRALWVPLTSAVHTGKPSTASKSEESSGAKNTQSDDSKGFDQLA